MKVIELVIMAETMLRNFTNHNDGVLVEKQLIKWNGTIIYAFVTKV